METIKELKAIVSKHDERCRSASNKIITLNQFLELIDKVDNEEHVLPLTELRARVQGEDIVVAQDEGEKNGTRS